MAGDRMALLETMRKAGIEGDADFLRQQVLAEAVMEAEVTELTGVPHGVRDPEHRATQRNGYRERHWDTRAGTVEPSIPRVRDGSYFPSPLEPRRRAPPGGQVARQMALSGEDDEAVLLDALPGDVGPTTPDRLAGA